MTISALTQQQIDTLDGAGGRPSPLGNIARDLALGTRLAAIEGELGVVGDSGTLTTDTIAEETAGAGVTADGVLLKDAGVTADLLSLTDASATGAIVRRIGPAATEGRELVVVDKTVSPAAVETAVFTVPAGAVIRSVQANVETALTGGGTTDSFGIGTAADPDKYGSSATLTKNSKVDTIPDWAVLASTEPLVLTGTASETTDGDTALTVGSVRVLITYEQLNSLVDAA